MKKTPDNTLTNTADNTDHIKGVTLRERAQMVLATLGRTPAEINHAFRRLAKQHHPDTRAGDTARFKLINEAYQLLTSGHTPKSPLLANDTLVLRVAGRAAAPLLDMQKEWEKYYQWHEKRFHDGDWFYPSADPTDTHRTKFKSKRKRKANKTK